MTDWNGFLCMICGGELRLSPSREGRASRAMLNARDRERTGFYFQCVPSNDNLGHVFHNRCLDDQGRLRTNGTCFTCNAPRRNPAKTIRGRQSGVIEQLTIHSDQRNRANSPYILYRIAEIDSSSDDEASAAGAAPAAGAASSASEEQEDGEIPDAAGALIELAYSPPAESRRRAARSAGPAEPDRPVMALVRGGGGSRAAARSGAAPPVAEARAAVAAVVSPAVEARPAAAAEAMPAAGPVVARAEPLAEAGPESAAAVAPVFAAVADGPVIIPDAGAGGEGRASGSEIIIEVDDRSDENSAYSRIWAVVMSHNHRDVNSLMDALERFLRNYRSHHEDPINSVMTWIIYEIYPMILSDLQRIRASTSLLQGQQPVTSIRDFDRDPSTITPNQIAIKLLGLLDQLVESLFSNHQSRFTYNGDEVVRCIVAATLIRSLLELIPMMQNRPTTSQYELVLYLANQANVLAMNYITHTLLPRIQRENLLVEREAHWTIIRDQPRGDAAIEVYRFAPRTIASLSSLIVIEMLYPIRRDYIGMGRAENNDPVDELNYDSVIQLRDFLSNIRSHYNSHENEISRMDERIQRESYEFARDNGDNVSDIIRHLSGHIHAIEANGPDPRRWPLLREFIHGVDMQTLLNEQCPVCYDDLIPRNDPVERDTKKIVSRWGCRHLLHHSCYQQLVRHGSHIRCPSCRVDELRQDWEQRMFPPSALIGSIFLSEEQRAQIAQIIADYVHPEEAERRRVAAEREAQEAAKRAELATAVEQAMQAERARMEAEIKARLEAEFQTRLQAEIAARPPPPPSLPAEEIARIFQQQTQALTQQLEERDRQRAQAEERRAAAERRAREQFEADRQAQQQQLEEIMRQARETFRGMQDPSERIAERRVPSSIVISSRGGSRRVPIWTPPDVRVPDPFMAYFQSLHTRQIAEPAQIEVDSTLTDCMNNEELFQLLERLREMFYATIQIMYRGAEVTYADGDVTYVVTRDDLDADVNILFTEHLPHFHPNQYNMQPVIDFRALVFGGTVNWQDLEQRCISGRFSSPKYSYKYPTGAALGDGGGGPGPAGGGA